MDETCHTYEWDAPHIRTHGSCHHIWMRRVIFCVTCLIHMWWHDPWVHMWGVSHSYVWHVVSETHHTYELTHIWTHGSCHMWMRHVTHMKSWHVDATSLIHHIRLIFFFDGYCNTVQGLLDWFEVDLGFTELSFIQINLCVLCVFVLYSRVSLSSCPFWTFCTASPARWECL